MGGMIIRDAMSQGSVFQPFSSRGTFETLLSIWLKLDTQNIANFDESHGIQ